MPTAAKKIMRVMGEISTKLNVMASIKIAEITLVFKADYSLSGILKILLQ